MATLEELERRLKTTETTLQAMFCAVTADLIMFQAAVTALREEGVLTERMVDRMASDAQLRLKSYDSPALSPQMVNEIEKQLEGLAKRLRSAVPSTPLAPGNGRNDGKGGGSGNGPPDR